MRLDPAVARIALASALVACARAEAPPSRALDVPPARPTASTRVTPTPPPRPREARVAASLLEQDGAGYWSPKLLAVEPPLVDLVRPCYERALAVDPNVAGWMTVDLTIGIDQSSTRLGKTSGLPDELTTCIVQRLRAVHSAKAPGWYGPPYTVYVSLG